MVKQLIYCACVPGKKFSEKKAECASGFTASWVFKAFRKYITEVNWTRNICNSYLLQAKETLFSSSSRPHFEIQ
jgi:hypothetical protein